MYLNALKTCSGYPPFFRVSAPPAAPLVPARPPRTKSLSGESHTASDKVSSTLYIRTVYFMQVGITNMSTVKLKIYLFFNRMSFVLECPVNIFFQNQNTVWKFQFRYYFLIAQLYWLKLIFWQTENRWNFCQLKKISIRSWVISKRVIYVFNSVSLKKTFQ